MKKLFVIMPLLLLLLLLASCGKKAGNSSNKSKIDVFNNSESKVDYDLSKMSSTMVYSQVYNMLANPNEYYDKTFRIKGVYANSFYDVTNQYYHYVVINDALACCNQGLEFVWNGDHSKNEYPSSGDEIVICGRFSYYNELGVKYNCIFIE